MGRFLFLLGLILAVPAAGQAPPAEITATLADRMLHLPLPAGYCAIDRGRPDEAALFDGQAQLLKPDNALLGIAVVCDELTALRDQKTPFGHYLEFMATEPGGRPIQRADAERSAYITEFTGSLQMLDSASLEHLVNERTQVVGVRTSVQRSGIIAQDEAAAYLGGVATYDDVAVESVTALTLAGGRALSCNFYDNKPNAGTTVALLAAAKAEARAVIAANGGSVDSSATATKTSENSWMIAIAAAVVLLAISGVTYLRRRR